MFLLGLAKLVRDRRLNLSVIIFLMNASSSMPEFGVSDEGERTDGQHLGAPFFGGRDTGLAEGSGKRPVVAVLSDSPTFTPKCSACHFHSRSAVRAGEMVRRRDSRRLVAGDAAGAVTSA